MATDLMKNKIRDECKRRLALNEESITNGLLTKEQVLRPYLDSISHGWGWKIRVELEHEFGFDEK